MKINPKLLNIPNIDGQRYSSNGTKYTIRIQHNYEDEINSAIVFCNTCCYVVGIGNPSQIWTYELGKSRNTTMTATINTHTANYVDVDLTFNETVWGGISVLCVPIIFN